MFGSLAELDGVPRVGSVTIDDLTLCAESFGYQPNKDDLALVVGDANRCADGELCPSSCSCNGQGPWYLSRR